MDNHLATRSVEQLLRNLSPPFLGADDAARYALAQLDLRNNQPQGGYLFTGPDGYCHASRPFEVALSDLLLNDALSMETAGNRLLPSGYLYVAYYFRDVDRQAEIQRRRPSWSTQRITLTQSLPPMQAVLVTHSLFQAFYTVGPQGCLVRFTPGEQASLIYMTLRQQVREQVEPALPAEHEPVEGYIHKLRTAGEVSVVETSAIWAGWKGPLNERWKVYAPDPVQAVPEPRQSPIFADAPAAMAFAHRLMLLKPTERQSGFLLKHLNRQAFMVTEPLPMQGDAFDTTKVFVSDTDGAIFVPREFVFWGVYCLAIDQPAPSAVKEPWLYERFVTPVTLARAMAFSRGIGNPGFALYLSVFDGAQLRYVFSHSHAEDAFYSPISDTAHPIDRGLQASLEMGTLSPHTFISRLAAAGELSVIKTSVLWDVAGKVGQGWKPFSRYQNPPLGPAFLLADDAARHAHEHIGSHRERGYIGLILQRNDQRFVATEPLGNPAARFDFSQVFIVERSGRPVVLYPGHTLHGVYCSRWRGDEVSNARAGYEAQVQTQMFTDVDIHRILSLRPGGLVVYLSGAADCLLRYQTYLAGEGSSLFERSMPAPGGSRIQHDLQAGTMVPSDVVVELALSGELHVVEGNPLWGPPGKIESDWSPPYELDVRNDPVLPQLGPVHADSQAAVFEACTHWRHRYGLEYCGLGLVLKHRVLNEFVASQTVPGPMFDRLVQACRFGAAVLTQTFQVHAVYHSVRGLAAGLSGHDAWIARHFIAADDFYCALYDQQGVRRTKGLETLPLYLSPLDGALLEYRSDEDPFRLFTDEKGRVDAHVLPAKLGLTLTQRSYVQNVARAGQLTVLTTSECWDVPGAVGEDWTPFDQISRRQLGPVFFSRDDAARYALMRLGSKRDRVYGGLILRRTDGLFTVTEPLPVDVEDFSPPWIRLNALVSHAQFLAGSTAVARYHSRLNIDPPFALTDTERAVYQTMFSTDFLGAVLEKVPFPPRHAIDHEYLLCADGALLCFTATGSALEDSLAKLLVAPSRAHLHPKNNALERAMRDGQVTPSEYVNRVARAAELRVVQGSELWGPAGKLTQWQANAKPDATRLAPMDQAFSPVFVQLPDVLRFIHRRKAVEDQPGFGVILKSRKSDYYMASHALIVQHGPLTLERVLAGGVAPAGHELFGLYVCPPESGIGAQDLERALRLKAPGKTGYLPVYQARADGRWFNLDTRQHVAPAHGALSFGPLFCHPDDAARHQVRPFKGDEYIGVIVSDAANTGFVAAEPLLDEGIESPVPRRLFLYESTLLDPSPPPPAYPPGYRLLAAQLFFKTMGHDEDDSQSDKQLRQHFVARDELGFYRNLLGVSRVKGGMCYVLTRQGALLAFTPRFTTREESLFSGLVFGPPSFPPGEWLSRLTFDGGLRVLDPDSYWTRRGRVKGTWKSVNGEEVPDWQIQPLVSGKDEL